MSRVWLLLLSVLLASNLFIATPPVAAAESTLSGFLMFPDSGGVARPMRNSDFEVWKSGFLGIATFVTRGSTDGSGFFSVKFNGDCDCWVTVFTRNPAVDVFCPVQSYLVCAPQLGQSPTFHLPFPSARVNDGESVNYGTRVLPTIGLIAEAAQIADTMLTAWLFVQSQTGISIRQASAQFPCGALCPGTVYFNPYVIRDIYMQSGISLQATIIHEYGHHVMLAAYDPSGGGGVSTVWPVPLDKQLACLVHNIQTACTYQGAEVREVGWTEGWADFFAMAVLDRSRAMGPDLESPGSGFATGDAVEGRVAAALWDLFQSPPSGSHFGVGFAPIFDTLFRHRTHSTFQAFYDDFRITNPSVGWMFNAAAFQNTINYNNPPRIVSLDAPTGSATSFALLSVTGADNSGGFLDGFISSATFEYSQDGGANWVTLGTQSSNLPFRTTQPSTGIILEWAISFDSPSVIVRARVTDNLGAVSGWTQSAPFSVSKGGCLIATAAYGSELAPQIQQLRETRDNILLQTQSGSAFMTVFNSIYYSFSPTIADWERQNPIFKEAVKITITPLITTLSILNYVDIDSEVEMLGYGIGVILLNIGMYFAAPAIVIIRLKQYKK